MQCNRKINLTYSENLVDAVASRCTEIDSGARNVDHILTDTLLPDLSSRILEKMAAEDKIETVHVTVGGQGFEFDFNPPVGRTGAKEKDTSRMEAN